MPELSFIHLNSDWNADPNAPEPKASAAGDLISVSFFLNSFAYEAEKDAAGTLEFQGCSRWRIDTTNDHACYKGEGRFSGIAPSWGEFFEIIGDDPTAADLDWNSIETAAEGHRHFLFYFRDEAFECFATSWSFFHLSSAMD